MERKRFKLLLGNGRGPELDSYRKFFRGRGFDVVGATDAPAVLDLVKSERPDLMILDETLPGRSTGVLSRLSGLEDKPDLRILMVGGRAAEAERVNRDLPDIRYLAKEGRDDLHRTVADLLNVQARQHARVPVSLPVRGGGESKRPLGRAVDLSVGGMCLETGHRYDIGSCLFLTFEIPGERREIEAPSWVCWLEERGGSRTAMGMEFADLMKTERESLGRYIDGNLAAEP